MVSSKTSGGRRESFWNKENPFHAWAQEETRNRGIGNGLSGKLAMVLVTHSFEAVNTQQVEDVLLVHRF